MEDIYYIYLFANWVKSKNKLQSPIDIKIYKNPKFHMYT